MTFKELMNNPYTIEVLGAILTSILFLSIFYIFRPKVKISPQICKTTNTENQTKFFVKFYNKSYLFNIIDVKLQLRLVETIQAPKGKNLKIKNLKLRNYENIYIEKRAWGKNEYNKHALILTIEEDLDVAWNNPRNQYLELLISARNSVTNFQRIFIEPYNDKDTVIKSGKFKSGSDTEII